MDQPIPDTTQMDDALPVVSDADTGKPTGRAQLQKALDAGPGALKQQVRLLLALSQLNGSQSSTDTPEPEAPQTLRQARLTALSYLAGTLSESQIKAIIKEASQIDNDAVRLPVMAKLAIQLPPQTYRTIVRDVWVQVNQVRDAAIRARTLYELAPMLLLVNDEPATASSLLQIVSEAQAIEGKEARLRSLSAIAPLLPQDLSLRILRRVLSELESTGSDSIRSRAIVALAPHLPHDLAEHTMKIIQTIQNPIEQARALTAMARHISPALKARLSDSALEAIDRIEGEEERADALINFAPNLEKARQGGEFPAMLEKALTISIMITRRHIRARVLVALAPHLTIDLQGEALAAVHSLRSERERAILLAELAPTLPSDMLVASLAVAHTMREQDSRVHALSVLAHHVPRNARNQTTLDALAAASNLEHNYERVRALVSLLDILPPHLLEQALTNALEATRQITNENARARALNLLGEHLPSRLISRSLDTALELSNPQQRLNALLGLIPAIPDKRYPTVTRELLTCARQMPLEYKRARALISIIPHLDETGRAEVLASGNTLTDPIDRAGVYTTLAHHTPEEERSGIIARAWNTIMQIEDGYDRASAISAIAPLLPPQAETDVTRTIIRTIRIVEDDYDKASAIALLTPLLSDAEDETFADLPDFYTAVENGMQAALSIPQQSIRTALMAKGAEFWVGTGNTERAYSLWETLLEQLIDMPLPDVLLAVGTLLPIIKEFAGDEGLKEIAHLLGIR